MMRKETREMINCVREHFAHNWFNGSAFTSFCTRNGYKLSLQTVKKYCVLERREDSGWCDDEDDECSYSFSSSENVYYRFVD
jgi:hypothetical protein